MNDAHAGKDPHTVRVEPQYGVTAPEEQDFLSAGLANAREAHERLLGLSDG
jgi:hypothetical protein